MKAVKGEEIFITTENKVGKLEEVTKSVMGNGINIRGISAYAVGDKAYFRLITSDNAKAKEILKKVGALQTKEVIIVDMPDEVGQLNNLAAKLKEANVDLMHIYGTTSKPNQSAIIVFSSNNNNKALELISS
ncbi:MAG: hypothetical protein Q8O30_08170 [Candidatus Omnitrophota bacterium]|nr:hypothetical protein [Candidatus Omnitrophota bacterium]